MPMFSSGAGGHPIKVVEVNENNQLILNEFALKSVLFHPKSKGKMVSVISVAGDFRKGKSFLLNFFIRFFKHGGHDNWLGNENEILSGFHWRGGSDRDTTGIFLWSEPYLLRTLQNEEVAIFLMDTQGAFDSTSTMKECATLFALSLMVSSIQIYNMSQNIQEDDLQHLHLFADYGRMILEETSHTPFQMIMFLVRDWSYSYEYPYGFQGGQQFLVKRLNANNKTELIETRNFIRKCFKSIKCFLMPHPGLTASSNPNFGGKLSDVDPQFKNYVVSLIEGIFQEKMFQIKEINGQRITTNELFEYFKIYCQAFQGNELPSPKTLLRATAEANHLVAKALAKEYYSKTMEKRCRNDASYLSNDYLKSIHKDAKNRALVLFEKTKKLGGSQIGLQYTNELNSELDEIFLSYCKTNTSRQSFCASKTPTTLLTLMIVNYMASYILHILWLGCFSFIFTFGFYLTLFGLLLWCYLKFNGKYTELLVYADMISNLVWSNVIQPVGGKFINNVFNFVLNNISTISMSNTIIKSTIQSLSSNISDDYHAQGDTSYISRAT